MWSCLVMIAYMFIKEFQSECSHEVEFDGIYHTIFCKIEVPKMWENSPVPFVF